MSTSSRINRRLSVLAALGVFASAFAFACGAGDDAASNPSKDGGSGADVVAADTNNSNPDTGGKNDVSIVLTGTYNMAAVGPGGKPAPIIATVWMNAPVPGGMPLGVGTNESPTWPGTNTVQIKNVPPGHYNVYSYLMTGDTDHRMGKLPTDPGGRPQPVDVVAGQTANVAVTFGFPPPSDGGSEADAPDGG